jgi:hypothetical protein
MGEIVAVNQICNDIDNVFMGYQTFEPERNIKGGHTMTIRVLVSVNEASIRAPTNSNQSSLRKLLSPLRTILFDPRKITVFLFGETATLKEAGHHFLGRLDKEPYHHHGRQSQK